MPEPRLSRGLVIKLERLLDMLYKPGELAAELGVSTETVMRSYVPSGAPVIIDGDGKTWINGLHFATWARECLATNRMGKVKRTMEAGQAYCLRCKQVIDIDGLRHNRRFDQRGVTQITGRCPACGTRVNRFVRAGAAI